MLMQVVFYIKECGILHIGIIHLYPRSMALFIHKSLIYIQRVLPSPNMRHSFSFKECGTLQTWGTHFHSRSIAFFKHVTHLHPRSLTLSIHESLIYIQGMWHFPNRQDHWIH